MHAAPTPPNEPSAAESAQVRPAGPAPVPPPPEPEPREQAGRPCARVLLVDDDARIHADFAKVLGQPARDPGEDGLARLDARLFGDDEASLPRSAQPRFELASVFDGRQAQAKAREALEQGRPFALAFVDMSMPGGWDGVETVQALWRVDPEVQVVICTAYRERTWSDVQRRLYVSDRLLLLKKPFDGFEVLQLATALAHKSRLGRRARREREELELIVAERTAELQRANAALTEQMLVLGQAEAEARETSERLSRAHEELEEAHAQAQAATLAKSEFLANMSHEIRTPMTAILGYADLLRDPDLEHAERLEQLDVIARSGRQLLGILGDILDWSTIESGRLRIQRVPCSPGSVLAEVVSLMRLRASAKGLALRVEFEGPVPAMVRTDPARLRQVLTHLLSNAIKFTERGEVRVLARLEPAQEAAPAMLAISVVDTGPGLSRAELGGLFRPFQQLDGSSTRRHGGAGLGLSIARRLAEHLGGDLRVESEPGRGSRFTARIETGPLEGVPLLVDLSEAVLVGRRLEDERAPDDSAEPLAGRRILLAEDGRDNQLLLSFYLRKAGAEVVIAPDGGQALKLAVAAASRGAPFHVIVSDMQMPVVDGYELARRLRDDGYRAPILALTAHALPGDREKCLAAGCNDYLAKPVDRGRLVALCARLAAHGSGLGNTTIRAPLAGPQTPLYRSAGPPAALPRRAPPTVERADRDAARARDEERA